jgi:hypothetical protein
VNTFVTEGHGQQRNVIIKLQEGQVSADSRVLCNLHMICRDAHGLWLTVVATLDPRKHVRGCGFGAHLLKRDSSGSHWTFPRTSVEGEASTGHPSRTG